MPKTPSTGDNLEILREHIPDDSVDLVYLDRRLTAKLATTSFSALHLGSSRKPKSKHSRTHGIGTTRRSTPLRRGGAERKHPDATEMLPGLCARFSGRTT